MRSRTTTYAFILLAIAASHYSSPAAQHGLVPNKANKLDKKGKLAAKDDLACQCRRIEQIAQRAANDQVLLDLPQVRPRRLRAPFLQVRPRYQESTSTGSLITSIHFESFCCGLASEALKDLTEGSRSFTDFALFAKGSSALA